MAKYRPTIKPGQQLATLPPEALTAVMLHPAQVAAVQHVTDLISQLRNCEEPKDFYDFQKLLFGHVYSTEERRAQCSRMIKRLSRGESVPADPPPSPAVGGLADLRSWELEAFVYERLARQYRTVGDGLAWRRFGYDRRLILTLSRNDSAGPMYGKDGLPYELGRIEELWSGPGHFALHHDLTNCLRMGDLSEFTADGGVLFREIKSKPHTDRKQLERLEQAVSAIMEGAELPGDRGGARLVHLQEPYITNMSQLSDLLGLAKRNGCHGMKLSHGRSLMATSVVKTFERWGADYAEGNRVRQSVWQQAVKRAGISDAMHHVRGNSSDTASRSPIQPPWSIYPFTVEDCAALTCDLLTFETVMSVEALAAELHSVGVHTEILLPPQHGRIGGKDGLEDVLRLYLGNRTLTAHASSLSLLLYELVRPDTWARGMKEALAMPNPPREPVLDFSNEWKIWHQ